MLAPLHPAPRPLIHAVFALPRCRRPAPKPPHPTPLAATGQAEGAVGVGEGQDAKHSKQDIDLDYVQHCFLVSAAWFFVLAVPLYVLYQEESPRDAPKTRSFNLSGALHSLPPSLPP